jgi:hypothetical protein
MIGMNTGLLPAGCGRRLMLLPAGWGRRLMLLPAGCDKLKKHV